MSGVSVAVSRLERRIDMSVRTAIESTLIQAEKVKPKIVDVDEEELDLAFRRNQVTTVNALVVSRSVCSYAGVLP